MKQVIISLLLCTLFYGLAGQESELFTSANKAYQQEDYKAAIASYTNLVASGKLSAELYYNMANAYLKDKQVGPAILYYEKALRLKPSDKNIQQNLAIAKEEVSTPITEIPEFFMLRFWKGLAGVFAPVVWLILQLISALFFLYGVYLWRLAGGEAKKMKGFVLMIVAFMVLLLAYFAGRTANWQAVRNDAGIVMTDDSLRSGPDSRSEAIEPLSSGVKVRILDTIDDWYKVSLVNKEQGWIKREAVELI